ncbi:hypothetical protein BDY21DRAFT_261643, partial [Lineolata rhizophorae]
FLTTLLVAAVSVQARVLHNYARQVNLQTFAGALGGVEATPILDSGDANRPFAVADATFDNIGAAVQRSCDQQFNGCANLANGGEDIEFDDCTAQK